MLKFGGDGKIDSLEAVELFALAVVRGVDARVGTGTGTGDHTEQETEQSPAPN